ncbi:DNA polymerase IV [Treponema primitia ZAS-2]|uniref:DNA polymerase IV n=1 Tax=Treponema primitia (strain ATCC BAA-887 / DSM 12427 / ZAS-2) TaxID=545694 RepID=F5YNE9_TREPZ|nr:DNA polymerase IV [Treponema primitia]AEF85344.1 DNA polymerase IV [Treponema primitia ZAS-2]
MTYFIHADLDAFYASVEQLDHPEYCGKPVIVGGLPGDRRSVVSTASYEARKFGVHSAMPVAQAYKLCPQGIYLRGNMKRYREKSDEVMAVFSDFTPDVKQISIDEAFLDITGTEKLFGPPGLMAKKLKEAVRSRTGLTVSLGLASNKYVAKIASGLSKPDGVSIVAPGEEERFMSALPVSKIWGAGSKTQEQFKKRGLKTCDDILRLSLDQLKSQFGAAFGLFLHRAVRGQAAAAFEDERGTHSMSAERTFPYDLYDEFTIETTLFEICETLMFRLLDLNWQSRTIFIKIRYEDFSTESAQETLPRPVSTINELFDHLSALFRRKRQDGRGVRLIGAGLSNLETDHTPLQRELFDTGNEKEQALEKYILEINKKFPGAALRKGRSLMERASKPADE